MDYRPPSKRDNKKSSSLPSKKKKKINQNYRIIRLSEDLFLLLENVGDLLHVLVLDLFLLLLLDETYPVRNLLLSLEIYQNSE